MTFKLDHYYMHKNALDTCIQVTRVFEDRIYIRWWALGYVGRPWILDMEEYVIYLKNLRPHDSWIELTLDDLSTPRNMPGHPSPWRL